MIAVHNKSIAEGFTIRHDDFSLKLNVVTVEGYSISWTLGFWCICLLWSGKQIIMSHCKTLHENLLEMVFFIVVYMTLHTLQLDYRSSNIK